MKKGNTFENYKKYSIMKNKLAIILFFQLFAAIVAHSQVSTQISTSYSGGSGANGVNDYAILSKPTSGQATIGAEATGDTWSSIVLGSDISGTRRFWSFSKRISTENHGLQLNYYNGTSFSNPIMSFSTAGSVGVGIINPFAQSRLHVKASGAQPWAVLSEASNSDRMIGLGHDGTNGIVAVSAYAGGSYTPLQLWTSNLARVTVTANGNVGIGTINPDTKLAVKGTVHAEEVKVDVNVPVPDYVFEKNYNLLTLAEVENYISQNKHLPEVPAAKEMETNGVNLGEMNMLLLKKVEELTLYMIELQKENEKQNVLIQKLLSEK